MGYLRGSGLSTFARGLKLLRNPGDCDGVVPEGSNAEAAVLEHLRKKPSLWAHLIDRLAIGLQRFLSLGNDVVQSLPRTLHMNHLRDDGVRVVEVRDVL